MKIKLSIALIFTTTLFIFGQVKNRDLSGSNAIEKDSLTIEFLKAKKVSSTFNLNSSSKLKSKLLKKISIKCKIESLNKTEVDINKFSLVDHKNKLRYRPMDISYQPAMGYMAYLKLLKTDLDLGDYYKMQAGIAYVPEIEDSFDKYIFDGYTTVELPANLGTKKHPKTAVIYFKPHKFNKFKTLFFFAIQKDAENPDLKLHYGDEIIAQISI
jgi:hypothetical protein